MYQKRMPIYLHKNIKIIKTSREKARQAYRNEKRRSIAGYKDKYAWCDNSTRNSKDDKTKTV